MTVSPLCYLPPAPGGAAPLCREPRRPRLRRSRGRLALGAAVPTAIVACARLFRGASAHPLLHVAHGALHAAGEGLMTNATASPTGDGSSCSVLDTLCLDEIDHTAGGFILEIFIFFWSFLALAIVCDEYLVASLETLCVRWEVREDVAGSTFMAFGSAAPEIIVNAVATIKSGADDSDGKGSGSGSGSTATDLGIAAIIGSGMIAFMLIPGICGFFGPAWEDDPSAPGGKVEKPLQLKRRPLLRDVLTYSCGLLLLSVFFHDGEIVLWEASCMVGTYFAYVCLVIAAPKVRAAWRAKYALVDTEDHVHLQIGDEVAPETEDPHSDLDYEQWRQPRAMQRRQRGRGKALLVLDRSGRRIFFPAARPQLSTDRLRTAYTYLEENAGGSVNRGTVVFAAKSNADFGELLRRAGCTDLEALRIAVSGDGSKPLSFEAFEALIVRAAGEARTFSIDGVEQPPVHSARLIMSSSDPRIEIDRLPPIPLPCEPSHFRTMAQVERWMQERPGTDYSLEWAEGSLADGWFYDSYVPCTIVRRHEEDNTYDVDWEDKSYSYKVPLTDLAPRGIRDAHRARPHDPHEAFRRHSKKLRECFESGALAPKMYHDALAELRERIYGKEDGRDASPRRIAGGQAMGSPRCQRPAAGTSCPHGETPRVSEYWSEVSGASALSAMRQRWWREEATGDYQDLPLWRWPLQMLLDLLIGFWQIVFRWTIPDTALAEENAPPNPLEKLYPLAFVLSFIWVAAFSFVISTIASRWADLSGLGNGFIGLLLVSSGAEVPDCIQSVTVARRGYGSMAVSNAIGSQNVNVLIGLGLPWLMYNAALGKSVKVSDHKGLQVAAFFQVGGICLNLFLLIGLAALTGETKAQLGRKKGVMLTTAYFCVLTGFALYDQLH